MKRDMELCRKILLKIEEQYVDTAIVNLSIDGYTNKQVAYHCSVLYDAGMISNYNPQYGDGELLAFWVGSLTWEGHDFLDKIREDSIWDKTKETIKSKGLPMILDVVKDIASAIITSLTAGAINSLI